MHPDKRNEFDRQLADKFDSFRPEVPGNLWDNIASVLDKQEQKQAPAVPIKQRRTSTRWISVAAALLVVCGTVYWYNRPVAVTYLQGTTAQATATVSEPPGETAAAEATPGQEATAADPEVERLDIGRLKQLFAKRNRNTENRHRPELPAAAIQGTGQPAGTYGETPLTDEAATPAVAETPLARNVQPAMTEAVAVTVPEATPPPVATEMPAETETLLTATGKPKKPFGVSNLLNYVVNAVDRRDEKLVTFSDDGEGSLKLDFNFGMARNRESR